MAEGVAAPNAGEVIIIRTNRYFDERIAFQPEEKSAARFDEVDGIRTRSR